MVCQTYYVECVESKTSHKHNNYLTRIVCDTVKTPPMDAQLRPPGTDTHTHTQREREREICHDDTVWLYCRATTTQFLP